VIPEASVEAFHERSMLLEEITVVTKFVGVVGGIKSESQAPPLPLPPHPPRLSKKTKHKINEKNLHAVDFRKESI
jgi:hypothetical protein